MSDKTLPLPLPVLDGPRQPGVTDPIWPVLPPSGFDAATYEKDYAGQIERQRYLHIVTADVLASSRADLRKTLKNLSRFADIEMRKAPPWQKYWEAQGGRPADPRAAWLEKQKAAKAVE